MNHEKEHKQEAPGEYKIIHSSLHLSTPMLVLLLHTSLVGRYFIIQHYGSIIILL